MLSSPRILQCITVLPNFGVCCVERNRRVLEGVRGGMWIIIIFFYIPTFYFLYFFVFGPCIFP